MEKALYICLLVTFSLASCAPGSEFSLPPDLTLVPGTDIPQQVATYVSGALTQTAFPATPMPIFDIATIPVGSEAVYASIPGYSGPASPTLYQSSSFGIQFDYPASWYLQEVPGSITLTSFDPNNPPHKLEWTFETTAMQFGYKVFIVPPGSFDEWVESARQTALANQLSITEEERFLIANGLAHRLSLVSGSSGVINQVLTYVNGRYLEINIEGNYSNNLAWTVLNSIRPFSPNENVPTATPIPTMPGPLGNYSNTEIGYSLTMPPGWNVDEYGMSNPNKEVLFYPGNAEPFIAYLSISLESRTLDQVINFYTQNMGALNVVREDTTFNGYPAVKYTFTASERNEYFIPYGNQLFLIATDRPNDGAVQSILMTFRFMTPPQPVTYDATMADNGKTFVLNIGDKLRLNLDYSYGWSIINDFNPDVLVGAGDGYFAFASGTTTLTMTGTPACLNSTPPCGMPSILYTITLLVR